MPSKTITVTNGDGSTRTITIPDRSRFAGVRNISRAVNALPLTDSTTSIQVTVPLKPEFTGVYNATAPVTANSTWTKVGGGATITACNYNGTDAYDYALGDSETWVCLSGVSGTDRPWKVPNNIYWTITGIAGTETITVNRTAPVITSDRKGESRPLLSKLVGGAAAAYSLRDLNDRAGNNKVVRVRRASDNHERDFLAKEVSNGTLQNWVNTQTVLPLDLQALTADGRTGSVIPAKAAYSLRNLSKNYTGNVVDVRRSSDDTVQGFTAAQVTDGTLLAFVTDAQVGWNEQPTFSNAVGTGSITSQSSTATTATVSFTGDASLIRETSKPNHVLGSSGDQVIFNISVSGLDSAGTLRLRTSGTNTTVGSSTVSNGNNQDITLNLTGSAGYLAMTAVASSGGTITFNSIKVLPKTGFVSKWYDQSGNDLHAVQATPAEQPLLVSAGALVADNGIAFDGSTSKKTLVAPSVSGLETKLSVFSASIRLSSGHPVSLSSSSNASKYFAIQEAGLYSRINPRNSTSVSANSTTSGTDRLTFALTTGDTVTSVGARGAALTTTTADYGNDFDSDDLNQILIGTLRTVSPSNGHYYNGRIQEIIIYAGATHGDQTDNRTAIEANIGEAHSIDLPSGVDSGENQVDGFVETWYDQSGNGSDATQLTAGSQPKIVNAGSLVTGGIDFLDGTDTFLETTNSDICNVPQLSLFTVLTPHIASSQTSAFSCGANVAGSSGYGGWVMNLNGYADRASFQTQAKGVTNSGVNGIHSVQTGVTSSEALVSFASTFPNASISRNGETAVTTSSMNAPSQPSANTRRFRIGCSFTFRTANFYTQPIKEIILYTSDQSANRPAIEANINNQYDIY